MRFKRQDHDWISEKKLSLVFSWNKWILWGKIDLKKFEFIYFDK